MVNLGAAVRSYSLRTMQSPAPTPRQRVWRAVLAAAAAGYRVGVGLREWSFASGVRTVRRLSCPVVCVGNLTVGGSGKTPCAIALAQWFRARGRMVGILLRGYGRRGSGVVIAADPEGIRASWQEVGDEAVLLARRLPGVPVLVGGDRFQAGGEAVRRFGVAVLVLDDGFQHRQLHRELDLVMVDATDPFGGGRLLPRGRLREPVAGLRRAHAIILSRTDQAPNLPALRRHLEEIVPGRPQILSRHRPSRLVDPADGTEEPLPTLRGRRLLAVSGIASPEGFHRTLTDLGGILTGALVFPDHHPYDRADLLRVDRTAQETRAELIVTTEKDAIRMQAGREMDAGRCPTLALQVDLEITEGADVLDRLLVNCGGGRCG